MTVRLITGSCMDVLPTLEAGSVQCVVTSPPYANLRSYLPPDHPDKAKEIGHEPTPDAFVEALVEVFERVKRVMRADATLWVNLGDSYSGSGKGPTGHNGLQNAETRQGFDSGYLRANGEWSRGGRKSKTEGIAGIAPKNLLLIPERFSLAMQDAGWIVRSRIAWCKKASMPESVRDRPSSAWEHIWMFSKSPRYFYDQDAVREKHSAATTDTGQRRRMIAAGKFSTEDDFAGRATGQRGGVGERMLKLNEAGANLRNFWLDPPEPPTPGQQFAQFMSFAEDYLGDRAFCDMIDAFNCGMDGAPESEYWLLSPEIFKGEHYAAFPSEIPRRCILAGTSEKGACADCGSPWVRSDNREKRYNSGNGNVPLQQMPGNAATNVIRGGQPEDRRTTANMSGVRCGAQASGLDGRSGVDARAPEAISAAERREGSRTEAALSADGTGPRADAGAFQGVQEDRAWQDTGAGETESVRADRAGANQRTDAGQSAQSAAPESARDIHGSGLAADTNGSTQPLLLLQEEVHRETPSDDRPCDSAEQGWSAQPGEHRGGVQAVQLGQVESAGAADLGLDLSRPQSRRAVELYRQSRLTPAHLEAIRSVGITDVGRGAATQSGTGKNTEDVQRLAAEAKQVLGGYYREFLLARRASNSWAPSCSCETTETRPCVVLDIFGGAGTVGLVSDRLGRDAILIELNESYVRLARDRIDNDAGSLFADPVQVTAVQTEMFADVPAPVAGGAGIEGRGM